MHMDADDMLARLSELLAPRRLSSIPRVLEAPAEDLLELLNRARRRRVRSRLPAIGLVGLGMLVAAGAIALASPRVRDQLRQGMQKAKDRAQRAKQQAQRPQ